MQKLTKRGVRIEFVKENLTFTGEDSPLANLMLSVMGPSPNSSARASALLEGLEELFTIYRLKLSPALRLRLGTINIIDSSHSEIRTRNRRARRCTDGQMVLRWFVKLRDPLTGDYASKVV